MPPRRKRGRGRGGKATLTEHVEEEEEATSPPRSPPRLPRMSPSSSHSRSPSTSVSSARSPSQSSTRSLSPPPPPPPPIQNTEVPIKHMGRKKKGKADEFHFNWTHELEEDLIDWWREHDTLYNTQKEEYHNAVRKRALCEEKAKAIGNGCTGEAVRIHIKYLRDKFVRILNDTGESGRGLDGEIDPAKLWGRTKIVWERLDFILPHVVPRPSKSTLKSTLDTDDEVELRELVEGDVGEGVASSSNRKPAPEKGKGKGKGKSSAAAKKGKGGDGDGPQASQQLGDADIQCMKSLIDATIGAPPKGPQEESEVDVGLKLLRMRILRYPSPERTDLLDHLLEVAKTWGRRQQTARPTSQTVYNLPVQPGHPNLVTYHQATPLQVYTPATATQAAPAADVQTGPTYFNPATPVQQTSTPLSTPPHTGTTATHTTSTISMQTKWAKFCGEFIYNK